MQDRLLAISRATHHRNIQTTPANTASANTHNTARTVYATAYQFIEFNSTTILSQAFDKGLMQYGLMRCTKAAAAPAAVTATATETATA